MESEPLNSKGPSTNGPEMSDNQSFDHTVENSFDHSNGTDFFLSLGLQTKDDISKHPSSEADLANNMGSKGVESELVRPNSLQNHQDYHLEGLNNSGSPVRESDFFRSLGLQTIDRQAISPEQRGQSRGKTIQS